MAHTGQITLLPVGHAKFAPDWCFGLFKRQYRRTKVGSLQAIAGAINATAECNHSQLVSQEDGSTIVSTYDWTDFFAPRMKKDRHQDQGWVKFLTSENFWLYGTN